MYFRNGLNLFIYSLRVFVFLRIYLRESCVYEYDGLDGHNTSGRRPTNGVENGGRGRRWTFFSFSLGIFRRFSKAAANFEEYI